MLLVIIGVIAFVVFGITLCRASAWMDIQAEEARLLPLSRKAASDYFDAQEKSVASIHQFNRYSQRLRELDRT